jgi:hypothetical protein
MQLHRRSYIWRCLESLSVTFDVVDVVWLICNRMECTVLCRRRRDSDADAPVDADVGAALSPVLRAFAKTLN